MTKPTKRDNTIKNKPSSTLHHVQPQYFRGRFAIRGSNTYRNPRRLQSCVKNRKRGVHWNSLRIEDEVTLKKGALSQCSSSAAATSPQFRKLLLLLVLQTSYIEKPHITTNHKHHHHHRHKKGSFFAHSSHCLLVKKFWKHVVTDLKTHKTLSFKLHKVMIFRSTQTLTSPKYTHTYHHHHH